MEKITEKQNPDIYKNLTKDAKIIVKKYARILIRGKKNKKVVPVLIDEEVHDSIELLLRFRKEAKISSINPYVFAIPSVGLHLTWLEADTLLRKFVKACKADMPETLKATELRKHIATAGISLNLSNNEIQNLSRCMGHEVKIHLRTYRQRLPLNAILQMSQLLEKAQGVTYKNNKGQYIETESDKDGDDSIMEPSSISPKTS